MTDDLTTRLRAAGALLDQRGEESLGTAGDDDGLRVFAIAPPAPARGRRGRGVLAAAAAVLVLALVAAVAWTGGEPPVGVAAADRIVALVPSHGVDGWDRLGVSEEALEPFEHGSILVTPADGHRMAGHERLARSMSVSVMPYEWFEGGYSDAGWEPVGGSGLAGHLNSSDGRDQVVLVSEPIDTETGRQVVQVTAGPDAVGDDMLALAALVDPEVPIEDQEIEGWDVLARRDRSRAGGRSRTSELVGDDGSFLSITTLTGVTDEAALMLLPPHVVDPVEVRGRSGWAAGWGAVLSLTWVESPGVVVQLSHGGPLPDAPADPQQLLAETLAMADDLVAVDADGWATFVDQATVRPDEVPMTTTSIAGGEDAAVPADDFDAWFEGLRADGGTFTIWNTMGQICWAISGEGEACDAGGHLDGPGHANPRVATDDQGQAQFVYGFLPTGAATARVTFQPVSVEARTDSAGRGFDAGSSLAGRMWVTTVPLGYEPDTVTYLDGDDQVVETHQVGATTG